MMVVSFPQNFSIINFVLFFIQIFISTYIYFGDGKLYTIYIITYKNSIRNKISKNNPFSMEQKRKTLFIYQISSLRQLF